MEKNQDYNSTKLAEGKLGIFYLKEIWASTILHKEGSTNQKSQLNHNYVTAVFDSLGIGLEPTYQYLFQESPSFEEFENWILAHGDISAEMTALFNTAFSSLKNDLKNFEIEFTVLDENALEHWDNEGYVVIPDAISKADCKASVKAIEDFLQIDPNNKVTWYRDHSSKQGIMVQMFRNEILNKNRFSIKIQLAYQQLWQRNDLIVSTDRVSFNPPENGDYKFPGPDLHWDVSLKTPIPYGLQGLLYLTDTPENQGAFTLVPGFHRKIEGWLMALPKDVNPRDCNLHQLGAKPISGNAGDFIIWNQMLPHGSSPNLGINPRIVQYINYKPLDLEIQETWI